jgi:L-Ala-D/L-Glu epimerase
MELSVHIEHWPLAATFTISRGSKTEAVVVTTELRDGACRGRGECVPYGRYSETPEGVVAAIEALRPALRQGFDRAALQAALPAGAARNALDCALWDLNAKQTGRPVFELAGLAAPKPLVTAYTISLAAPEAMAQAAERAAFRP